MKVGDVPMGCLHDGHRERMRARIEQNGIESLQDHEMLEWLLFHTIPRGDVNALAHLLLNKFGTFHGVLSAEKKELLGVPGIGEKTASFLSSLLSVYDRYEKSKQKQNVRKFRSLDDISDYVRVAFANETDERVHALVLNSDLHLIEDEIISYGLFSQVPMDLRQLISCCLTSKASSVVLAHNHPSGILFPSTADIHQTQTVSLMLKQLHVNLLDHFLVGNNEVRSLRDFKETAYLFF